MDDERIRTEIVKELESFDPDELVLALGLSSDQIIRAFPGHVLDYARSAGLNFNPFEDEDADDETAE